MNGRRSNRRDDGPKPPLDTAALERLALFYVGRFATTRARLADYLSRKLRERGWPDDQRPDVVALVERLAGLGYIDDAAFAFARASGLQRRGYGPRRVAQSLRAAKIAEEDASAARGDLEAGDWDAALTFARRKRIGPYAADKHDRLAREKALGAMLRAGHSMTVARRIIDAPPGEVPDQDG